MKKNNLLWLDLEMTGLDPMRDRIIEFGAIVTDWDFNELASEEAVVKQSPASLKRMDAWNQKQHKSSGLIDKVPKGITEAAAESLLLKLVDTYFDQPVILAGNSIHQDRAFIRRYWPTLESKLHYRMLDVSAWKVVMMNKYGVGFKKPDAHRALSDIRGSIEELKYYLSQPKTG